MAAILRDASVIAGGLTLLRTTRADRPEKNLILRSGAQRRVAKDEPRRHHGKTSSFSSGAKYAAIAASSTPSTLAGDQRGFLSLSMISARTPS